MINRFFVPSFAILALTILVLVPAEEVNAKSASLSVTDITTVVAPPTCDVRSTKKWMTAGGTTKIVWESKRADYLENFMSDTTHRPTKGSQRVAIATAGKYEFPLTFAGPGGKTTCTAKIFVHPKRVKNK